MWMHLLQKLDDRCLGSFSPWITKGMSMLPQSAGASQSRVVAHGCGRCWCLLLGGASVCCLMMLELDSRCCC